MPKSSQWLVMLYIICSLLPYWPHSLLLSKHVPPLSKYLVHSFLRAFALDVFCTFSPQRAMWLAPLHLPHFYLKEAFMAILSKIIIPAHRISSLTLCFPFLLNALHHITKCLFHLFLWCPVSFYRICKLQEGKCWFACFVNYVIAVE